MKHDISLHDPNANWHELSSCEGKQAFDTFAAANRVARRRMKNGTTRVAYKCAHCKKFHVGGSSTSAKKPMKEV